MLSLKKLQLPQFQWGGGGGVNIAYFLILNTGGMENPVNIGKKFRSSRRPCRPSRTTSRKHTGAIISEMNSKPLPMDMVLHKIMRRKHTTKWLWWIHYKPSKMWLLKTSRKWKTSPPSTWLSHRALTKHKKHYWCYPIGCRHYRIRLTPRNLKMTRIKGTANPRTNYGLM